LYYEFEAPNTVYGDELLEHIKRGELAGSSFAFHCSEDKWEKRDGILYRTITKIDILADVSPVFEPAYLDTYVDKRGMNDLEDKEYEDYIINKMDTHLNEIFEMVR
jgi:HK97 family phage prohead protease